MTAMTPPFTLREVPADDQEGIADLIRLHNGWYETFYGANPGSLPDHWQSQLTGDPYFVHRIWIVRGPAGDESDVPLGLANLTLPLQEDTNQAWVELSVPPEHRGRGVARFLVENALRPAIEKSGRDVVGLFSELEDKTTEENSLTREFGLEPKSAEITQVLDLPLDQDLFQRLWDDAAPYFRNYRIDGWVGDIPEKYIEQWCALANEFSNALPMEDFESELPVATPERTRECEERNRRSGHQYVTSVAFAEDGSLVANAQAEVSRGASCTLALQANLIVTDTHRGHRLGMAVKLEGLRLLNEHFTDTKAIATWNSRVNQQALGLNRKIGFRQIGREVAYQGQVQRGVE